MQMFDDRAFIEDEAWPYWPLLPLKRYGGKEIATLISPTFTERIGIPLIVLKSGYHEVAEYADIEELPRHDYVTIDELLADGWVVD